MWVTKRDVAVRRRHGKIVTLLVGQCSAITSLGHFSTMTPRAGQEFTHFVSLEVRQDQAFELFKEKLSGLQEDLNKIFEHGKLVKPVGTLTLAQVSSCLSVPTKEAAG